MLIALRAHAAQIRHEQEGRAWLAYHIGVMVRADDPPTLDELMPGHVSEPDDQPMQSDDHMLFAMQRLAAQSAILGGADAE